MRLLNKDYFKNKNIKITAEKGQFTITTSTNRIAIKYYHVKNQFEDLLKLFERDYPNELNNNELITIIQQYIQDFENNFKKVFINGTHR